MQNDNKSIVLRSDDPFKHHMKLENEEKEREKKRIKPIPSFHPSKTGVDPQAYKQYYKDKNPWVEFG